MREGIEEDKKKNKVEIFSLDFPNCEKNQCNSGTIFDITRAKCYHL